jgi:hypothetical protein
MNFGASLRGASALFLPIAAASALVYSAAAHEEVTVAITRADCARLVEHVPASDVAYQPGVDVHGREVVPADLNGGIRIELPETILIPIEVDLLERFGIPANPALFDARAGGALPEDYTRSAVAPPKRGGMDKA